MIQTKPILGRILLFIKERGADLLATIFPHHQEDVFEVGEEVHCPHLGNNAVITSIGDYIGDAGKRVIVEVDAPFQWGKLYRHRVVSNTDHLIKKNKGEL